MIIGAYSFALGFDVHDKELLLTDYDSLKLYRENTANGMYSLAQNVAAFSDYSGGSSYIANNKRTFSYNGRYLIVELINGITRIYGKNSAGRFSSQKLVGLSLDIAAVKVDDQDNFYMTRNTFGKPSEILKYRFEGDNFVLKSTKILPMLSSPGIQNHYGVGDIQVENNIVFASRVGTGISLHASNSSLTDITVPSLQTYYPYNWIHPYKSSNASQLWSIKKNGMGRSIAVDKQYLLVSNEACDEVYIYKLNNLLKDASLGDSAQIENVNICNTPATSSITGFDVTIGGNCEVELGVRSRKNLSIYARNEIYIKKGTRIVPSGTSGRAKTHLKITGFDYPYPPDGCSFNETINSRQAAITGSDKNEDTVDQTNRNATEDLVEIAIVPNPVKSNFAIIASNYDNEFSIQISDMLGRKILVKSNMITGDTINFGNQPKGLYIIVVTKENGERSITKFLKK